jgi:hypothetical protein
VLPPPPVVPAAPLDPELPAAPAGPPSFVDPDDEQASDKQASETKKRWVIGGPP